MRSKVSVAGALPPSKLTVSPPSRGLHAGHLGLQEDVLVPLADPFGQRVHDVLVGAGDELVHQLDDGDPGAEFGVHGGHFQADDPAADDQQPLRDAAQLQRAGGVDHPRVVVREERQRAPVSEPAAMIACSKLTVLVPSAVCDVELVHRGELAVPR